MRGCPACLIHYKLLTDHTILVHRNSEKSLQILAGEKQVKDT